MQWDNSSLEQWEQGHDSCVQLIDLQSSDLWDARGKNVQFTAFIYTWLWKVFIEAMITLHFCFLVTAWKLVEGFETIHDHGIL